MRMGIQAKPGLSRRIESAYFQVQKRLHQFRPIIGKRANASNQKLEFGLEDDATTRLVFVEKPSTTVLAHAQTHSISVTVSGAHRLPFRLWEYELGRQQRTSNELTFERELGRSAERHEWAAAADRGHFAGQVRKHAFSEPPDTVDAAWQQRRSGAGSRLVDPRAREFRLFVYGSLLPGEPDHALLDGAERLGVAQTPPEYYLIELNACAALVHGGPLQVQGELFLVDAERLRQIDLRKQHPVLFQRRTICLANGAAVETYLMKLEQVRGRRRLKVGDWRQRFGVLPTQRQSPWARWARERSFKR
jgi:gamma-glutamylaminecyclotransferase